MGRLIYLAMLPMLPLLAACGGGNNRPLRADTYISGNRQPADPIASIFPTGAREYVGGDTVRIGYALSSAEVRPDSVVLSIRGARVTDLSEGREHLYVLPENPSVGMREFKVAAYKDGEKTEKNGRFVVKPAAPDLYGYRTLRTYDHDRTAYTQGLFWHEGYLYESTGLEGRSTLRQVDLASGEVVRKIRLDDEFFGEGIALLNGKIYMLTWKHNQGFVYDAGTFEKVGEFGYPGEGWGITTDGEWLYMSNGSENIHRIDPDGFRIMETIQVYSDEGKVLRLNELEWIEGEIWANVYLTDRIMRIDPRTGAVRGVIDLKGILKAADKDMTTDVLNGIAYDAEEKKIYVTGKNWCRLFEIEVVRQ